MARSTNEQNKTQNCNTRKASQKATQSTTQKTTNSTTDCGCGCGTKGKDDGSKKKGCFALKSQMHIEKFGFKTHF